MAAKSLRLTASARCPIDRASVPSREMAARHDGVDGCDQFRVRRQGEQRRVIADAEYDAGLRSVDLLPRKRIA